MHKIQGASGWSPRAYAMAEAILGSAQQVVCGNQLRLVIERLVLGTEITPAVGRTRVSHAKKRQVNPSLPRAYINEPSLYFTSNNWGSRHIYAAPSIWIKVYLSGDGWRSVDTQQVWKGHVCSHWATLSNRRALPEPGTFA